MRPTRRAKFLLLAVLAPACGGSGGTGGGGSSAGSPSPPASAANPCTAALAASGEINASASSRDKRHPLGNDDRDPRDFLALHRLPREGALIGARAGVASAVAGNIVVLQDDGSLVVAANRLDLQGRGLRFEPNASGGYDVRSTAASFRADLGRRVRLGDDQSSPEPLGAAFAFYGRAHASVFVNSDGNLTFGAGDAASTERSLGRVLAGPPRVAIFFADLDPSAGGGVFVNAAPDAFTVSWCAVPGFESTERATAQASLFPDGAVEIRIDAATTLGDAVVALSPGSTDRFAAVDLSSPGPSAGGAAAVGERFAAEADLDLVAVTRRLYAEQPDAYDQAVLWADTRVTGGNTFAFETTIHNAIEGIGQAILDLTASFGSGGRLQSVVVMDSLGKYPSDPAARVPGLGEDSTLSLLAHESGHRWGATLRFRDASGAASDLLLGRQLAHWSFFFDSDASVLEGNDIEDRGGGSFRTVGAVERYGPLDLYAMGLAEESEIPTVFFVENPVVTSPAGLSLNRESDPRTGVAFTGTARAVTIDEIVAAMGPRRPGPGQSPREHRQVWVYVVGAGRTADPTAIDKLEGFRRAFEPFFEAATDGRMRVFTGLE